jgi:hypothetical protein
VPAVEAFHRLEVETLRKQIAGLQEELRKAKAAAALARRIRNPFVPTIASSRSASR